MQLPAECACLHRFGTPHPMEEEKKKEKKSVSNRHIVLGSCMTGTRARHASAAIHARGWISMPAAESRPPLPACVDPPPRGPSVPEDVHEQGARHLHQLRGSRPAAPPPGPSTPRSTSCHTDRTNPNNPINPRNTFRKRTRRLAGKQRRIGFSSKTNESPNLL
jgi:hypothetical protein